MRLRDYQWRTDESAIFPKNRAVEYLGLGLVSEAGEVAGKIKKVIRDKGGEFNEVAVKDIAAELGDVSWYMAQLASHLDLDWEDDILAQNIEKLKSRTMRGVLKGSGDNR